MSVPYETAAHPEEHLDRLLGRALNSFELPDEVLTRLDSALAYDGSLHSAHHSAGRHRETYRHTWLLTDGSVLTLWELVHNTAPGGLARHEVYADEAELSAATARLPLPADEPGLEPVDTLRLPPVRLPPMVTAGPPYAPADSADHLRRLLRRAENLDRPGPQDTAVLRTAYAHEITQAFGPPCRTGTGLCLSLYEHVFLLPHGRRASLWEVEHTATPDGRHMCEVYVTEAAARAAMERRA
ncbi:DUF6227 family protein [Streptomyces abyssomicinicus]|uniref:DUF6227 family protein n=1 Tax=Streptomyces abyssomicinicus TaxID=574929 RepID=UPI0012500F98|nr:DUF6227 family protein [Streptomyces abyssomicinicus]